MGEYGILTFTPTQSLWGRNLGWLSWVPLAQSLSGGVVKWSSRAGVSSKGFTWEAGDMDQLPNSPMWLLAGLGPLPRGILHRAAPQAGFLQGPQTGRKRACPGQKTRSLYNLISEVTSTTFAIFCALEASH